MGASFQWRAQSVDIPVGVNSNMSTSPYLENGKTELDNNYKDNNNN